MSVTVEISECPGATSRIDVRFTPTSENVHRVRQVSGRTFIKSYPKHWHVPLDMETCRRLREVFGEDLVIGPKLWSWAKEASREEASLGTLALADTAELTVLPFKLSKLYRAIHVGPIGLTFTTDEQWSKALAGPGSYQTADVRFLADAPAPLNGNEQGTGKTPEWIAAVWEAGLEQGVHLVIATSAAVDGTWEPELEEWQEDAPCEVGVYACTGTRAQREETIAEFMESGAEVRWLVVNPEMIRWKKCDAAEWAAAPVGKLIEQKNKAARTACRCDAHAKPHAHYVAPYPELFNTAWDTCVIDECHKNSIRNHKSLSSQAIGDLTILHKRCAMSGTPMKKRGADLWGILNWLRPDVFTSFWRFAGDYFEIEDNGFGKKIGKLDPARTDAFFRSLMPYMLRRLKKEVLPWLPPKHHVNVTCVMGPKQAKLYERMAADGEAALEGGHVDTTSVLAEFTRLKQFATAVCTIRSDGKVIPTRESCKLDAMLDKMDEAGMFDEDATRKQVVFSQSREIVELTAAILEERGLKVQIISGKNNKKGERRRIREEFQKGDTRVLCIVTQAGGVSLTLDMADEAHFIDESWAPDEDQQAEDRIHRASRVHQVTILHYRSELPGGKETIDSYVQETAMDKAEAQSFIMDVRRKMLQKASA